MPALGSSRQLVICKRSRVSDFVLLLPFCLGLGLSEAELGRRVEGIYREVPAGRASRGGGGKEPEQVSFREGVGHT